VGATLSELEHKLRELELELSAVRRNPPTMRAPGEMAAPAQATRPSAVPPTTSSVRLVDEALEPAGAPPVGAPPVREARPAAPAPAPAPAAPADPPPPLAGAGFARHATAAPSETEPLAPPPEPAATGTAQLVADVRSRMAEVADQLEQLMRLRRELELRAHELESVAQPVATQVPGPEARAPEPPAAAALAAAVSWPRPDSAPTPGTARAPGAAGAATGEAAWFEGHVEVDAGPFADIAALGDFELKLAQLPQVAAARVRGYSANRALIDVHLRGPAALVRDLRGVWGTGFTVLEAQAGRLSLVLDSALAGERWG
jgi:hypothetical protein